MASTIGVQAILLLFPAAMAMAASMDLLTMTIPNRLTLALAAAYFPLAFWLGVPLHEIGVNLSCGFAVLVVSFGFFSMGWIGGGDAKLAAATALWLGWGSLLDYSLTAAIYGGVLTLILLGARKLTLPGWAITREWVARLMHPKGQVPYGIALAAAGIMAYPHTQFWQALHIG